MRLKSLFIWMLLLLIPVQGFAAEKLIFAIDLIRHGDRSPTRQLKNSNYEWKEGLGQLTAEGMRQEFELGQSMRRYYVEQTHLLPPNYRTGIMYVRSTDVERTLMSAESFLMGLYPEGTGPQALPHAYQPIPVHTAPINADDIIYHVVNPVELNKLKQKYVFSTPEWKQKEAELKPYFKHWAEATDTTIDSLDDLDIGDAVFIHNLHNLPMPAGLTQEDIKLIIDANEFTFVKEHQAREVSAAYSQQLVDHINDTIQSNAKSGEHLRYALLSAHDTTISSVLSVLGAPLTFTPPYASDLNFAVFDVGSNHYVVRVTFNKIPVTLPACGGTECTLTQFAKAAAGNRRV
jgi:lysosomal acid phosphatase